MSKKLPLNIRNTGSIDEDFERHNDELNNYLASTTNANITQLEKFLSRPEFIAGENDNNNIFIPGKSRYIIPELELNKFFILLENVRRDGISMIFAEKQDEKASGIVIDVDIFYVPKITESKIDDHLLRDCVSILMRAIEDIFDLTPLKQITKRIPIAITKRDKPVTRDHNGSTVMSEGFHILIPSIKISRPSKHFLINRIIKTGIFEKRINEALGAFLIDEKYACIDEGSRYVPVYFVGCKRDPKKPPYELFAVYDYYFSNDYSGPTLVENKDVNDNNQSCIIVQELSVNYEVPPEMNGIIKKVSIMPNVKYSAEIDSYKVQNRQQDVEEEIKLSGEMSLMSLHDPEFVFIRSLLDILSSFRSQVYSHWIEVLMILASISDKLKPLGEYFSRKSPEQFLKTGIAGFETVWNSMHAKSRTLPTGKRKGIRTLIWLAKQDNPKRFDEVMKRSILQIIHKTAYKQTVNGDFEHVEISDILYHMFSNKYFSDKKPGERKLSWYEFVIPGEHMEKGEIFKYRCDDTPRSLELYMSSVLVNIFEKIYQDLHESRHTVNESADVKEPPNAEAEKIQKRKHEIMKGIGKTIRNLKKDGNICSIIRRATTKFEKRGFASQMDQDENILGVGNGVLVFNPSGSIELLQTQHDYMISMFTTVDYKVFDPRDPYTKHLLKALRSMFRDDESDSHLWLMCALASALVGTKKEPFIIMLLGTGREGKSTLMEMWRAALGQYGVKLPIGILVGERSKSEAANPAAMSMENKRAASYQEPDQKDRMNISAMKEQTGGEKVTGRALFQGQREFEPKCVHICPTNYLIDISTTDDATWRRLKVIKLMIKFFNANDSKYDPTNPYHRVSDPHADRFSKDPEFLSAFLSIMAYYWQILNIKYDGKLVNIPHPHIEYETAKYRTSKDSIDEFITRNMIRTPPKLTEMNGERKPHIERISVIIDTYGKWMESQARWYAKGYVESSLENSKIGKMLEQDRVSKYIKGFRFLRPDEQKNADEEYIFDISFGDLLAGDYKKMANINAKNEEVKTPDVVDEKAKTQLEDAIKTEMLSDTARATLKLGNKIKDIEVETIEQYYERITLEHDQRVLTAPLEKRAKSLEDQENKFVEEIINYDNYKRKVEIRATEEEGRKFRMQSKKATENAFNTMSADPNIVEGISLPPLEELANNTSGKPVIITPSESDSNLLDSDSMF